MAFNPKYTIIPKINKALAEIGRWGPRPTDKPEFSVEFSGKISTIKKL